MRLVPFNGAIVAVKYHEGRPESPPLRRPVFRFQACNHIARRQSAKLVLLFPGIKDGSNAVRINRIGPELDLFIDRLRCANTIRLEAGKYVESLLILVALLHDDIRHRAQPIHNVLSLVNVNEKGQEVYAP